MVLVFPLLNINASIEFEFAATAVILFFSNVQVVIFCAISVSYAGNITFIFPLFGILQYLSCPWCFLILLTSSIVFWQLWCCMLHWESLPLQSQVFKMTETRKVIKSEGRQSSRLMKLLARFCSWQTDFPVDTIFSHKPLLILYLQFTQKSFPYALDRSNYLLVIIV